MDDLNINESSAWNMSYYDNQENASRLETFETPFTKFHTRRLFISVYVVVFTACVIGK